MAPKTDRYSSKIQFQDQNVESCNLITDGQCRNIHALSIRTSLCFNNTKINSSKDRQKQRIEIKHVRSKQNFISLLFETESEEILNCKKP